MRTRDHEPKLRIIACGALVRELRAVLGDLPIDVTYLPANLHNRPERIAPAVAEAAKGADRVVVAYADCGTGGHLAALGYPMLPGAHCYEFFAGADTFAALQDGELGTFYLTDFLARHFDAIVWQGLGLDRHPELRDAYFGNYTRVVYLSQQHELIDAARSAADKLGLAFEHRPTGLAPFSLAIRSLLV